VIYAEQAEDMSMLYLIGCVLMGMRGECIMAEKSQHFCNHHGCNQLTKDRYCAVHMAEHEQTQRQYKAEHDKTRGTATERGYNSKWRKARITYLSHHPLCAECERQDKLTPADVVDHIIPHKGDSTLFWNTDNWQPLCKRHHDIKTAKEDGGWGNGI